MSEALEALETMPYDLILSKIKLQDGNGCSFIQKWQAQGRARGQSPIPAIAISNDLHEGKQALQAGFQMFLTKPVCSDEVIVAGTELLRLQNQIQRV